MYAILHFHRLLFIHVHVPILIGMRNHKKSLSKYLIWLLPSVCHIIIKKRKTVRVDEYKRKQIQIYKSNKKLLIQENQLTTIFLNRFGASGEIILQIQLICFIFGNQPYLTNSIFLIQYKLFEKALITNF